MTKKKENDEKTGINLQNTTQKTQDWKNTYYNTPTDTGVGYPVYCKSYVPHFAPIVLRI